MITSRPATSRTGRVVPDHPGYVGLISRIEELMPKRRTLVARFWRRNRWTMASVMFAAAAVALLGHLSLSLDNQLNESAADASAT